MPEKRNQMVEASRIARGKVKNAKELKASDFDALFVPGGFGAAKNFSDFASKGGEMSVHEDIEKILKDFHASQKYIGLCCISPVLAAKVFGSKSGGSGVSLTLGNCGSE